MIPNRMVRIVSRMEKMVASMKIIAYRRQLLRQLRHSLEITDTLVEVLKIRPRQLRRRGYQHNTTLRVWQRRDSHQD